MSSRSFIAASLPGKAKRSGSSLLEVVASAALLATLFVIINRAVVGLHAQTALADRHFVAQQTLENMLDEFTSRDWDSIQASEIQSLIISTLAKDKLSNAQLEGEVIQEEKPVLSKRVALRLSWEEATTDDRRLLSLSTWVYPKPKDMP